MMNFSFSVRNLSQAFYNDYPASEYPEILTKNGRPYTCLMITGDTYLICIPYRSSIPHREAFLFSNTKRSSRSRSGLDYKKTVLITNPDYIDSSPAVIDADEYRMTKENLSKIASGINSYIQKYVNHVNGTKILHQREYNRRYQFSTLPYFNNLLGL